MMITFYFIGQSCVRAIGEALYLDAIFFVKEDYGQEAIENTSWLVGFLLLRLCSMHLCWAKRLHFGEKM